MECKTLKFSQHAITQMFTRSISRNDTVEVVENGEIIAEYPDDKPFPSMLILGFDDMRPLHIVVAYNEKNKLCIVVTAYVPDNKIWESDFKRRKNI